MGNIIPSKIIPKVKTYKNILLFKLINKAYYPKQKLITQSSSIKSFEVFNMPKRGRPSQPEEAKEYTGSEDEFHKEEKVVKKPRKTVEKLKKPRKAKTVEEKSSEGENNVAEISKPKSKKKGTKSKTVSEKKNDKLESESEIEEEMNSETKQRKSTRKQSQKTKKKLLDNVEQKESDASNPVTENEDECDNDAKKSKRKKTTATKLVNQTGTDLDTIDFNCDKVNAEGQKPNIRICSWNVAGVRAMIKKNGINYIAKENPDIMVLQETKCNKDKLPNEVKIDGYKYYYLDSEKSGYCGMALYTKEEPISLTYGIKNPEFDDEGRIITAEYPNFYLVTAYVPNAGQKLVTLPKRLKWNEAFKTYIKGLDAKKPVVICGDMNVAHKEIDLKNPKGNVKNAGFTKEEREGMTDFLAEGFVDTFRHLYPDRTDAYTFWSYFANSRSKNIGWRIDYFLVSERIKDKICDVVFRSEVYGSDHCPIVLYANF